MHFSDDELDVITHICLVYCHCLQVRLERNPLNKEIHDEINKMHALPTVQDMHRHVLHIHLASHRQNPIKCQCDTCQTLVRILERIESELS